MMKKIAYICLIDDPLDLPGQGKVGGGQQVTFDLGRRLISKGFCLDYFTLKNGTSKANYDKIGDRCSITRMTAGQPRYFTGDDVGLIIESYVDTWLAQIGVLGAFDIIIAQHWTSAFLGVRYREMTGSECPILYFPLSFGRERLRGEPPRTTSQIIRERLEPPILSRLQFIAVGTPSEKQLIEKYYQEIDPECLCYIPLWTKGLKSADIHQITDHIVSRSPREFYEGI